MNDPETPPLPAQRHLPSDTCTCHVGAVYALPEWGKVRHRLVRSRSSLLCDETAVCLVKRSLASGPRHLFLDETNSYGGIDQPRDSLSIGHATSRSSLIAGV